MEEKEGVFDFLVENGKIKQIKENITPSTDCQIIDGTDCYLTPGLIDCHTHLGMYDEGTGSAGHDANESSEKMTPEVRAIDGVYVQDIGFEEARKYGVTTVAVLPGSRNVIGGVISVIKTMSESVCVSEIKRDSGLKIALGENPKTTHGLTRLGIMSHLRSLFHSVKQKMNEKDFMPSFYEENVVRALKREIPIHVHAHRADDILSSLRFAKEFNLELRIEHATEGHLVIDELKKYHEEHGLYICLGPTMTRRSKVELQNKTWETYGAIAKANIPFSITTDHPYLPIQYLSTAAAFSVKEGLDEKIALESITKQPAKSLGVYERIGSLKEGKDADFVLWSGHPFHYKTHVKATYINGVCHYEKK